MLGQSIILLLFSMCTTFALEHRRDSFAVSYDTPRYQESLQNFELAAKYLQWHLSKPFATDDDIDFAILVAAVGGLVEEFAVNSKYFDHLQVLDRYSEYGGQNYVSTANAFDDLLHDIRSQIAPIVNLINSLCTPEVYFNCNEIVDNEMRSNPYLYLMPSKVLIHLGKVSKTIIKNKILIEKLVHTNEVLPYLSIHGQEEPFMTLIKRMSKTYELLQRMSFMSV